MNMCSQLLLRSVLLTGLVMISVLNVNESLQAAVATTSHNLSVSGTGTIKASSEDRICIFCHISHNALPIAPLWNRASSGAVYTPYNSSTIVAAPGQPTGASILCLSCHDGTIALGDISGGEEIQMTGGAATMPTGNAYLGTNLADDHPISFVFSQATSAARGDMVSPSALVDEVKLDSSSRLQCTTCHDPHDNTFGKFLVVDNRGSALCETCHKKTNWPSSPHKTSLATWNGIGNDPWPNSDYSNVADNACQSCHMPHNANNSERLLTYVNEEDTCTVCHNGNVSIDVLTDFSKPSSHPISRTTAVHRPDEPVIVRERHVECTDCHNPHAEGRTVGVKGVSGVDITNTPITPVTDVYQVCFRCHGDSPKFVPPRTSRQIATNNNNIREMFSPSNPSFHPIAAIGQSRDVPSLIPPLNNLSRIGCDGCHGSDRSSSAPHGSNNVPILKLQYIVTDRTAESSAAYALCYSCHDRNSILADTSFAKHRRHIVNFDTPCNICHDPHGGSLSKGASQVNNARLINCDTNVVSVGDNGKLEFVAPIGTVTPGNCSLRCHGRDHNVQVY